MSYNFELESGNTVKFPVGGKYCDRDIVVSATGGGITPTGTINITSNGEHDVTNYATANVNVPDEFFEKFMARSFTEFESDTTYAIRYGMFRSHRQLVRVSFPNTPGVENEAFRFDAALEEADLPKAVQFDAYAFAGCTKLKRLIVPSLRIMRGNTLNQCTSLEDFPYFGNIEEIGGYEFRQCPIKQKVWDFENLTKIAAQYSFSEASAEVVIMRKAITSVDRTFHGMPSVRVIDLHKAFAIPRYNFQNSPNLEAVILRDEENLFSFRNIDIFDSNENFYFYVPVVKLESYKSSTNASAYPNRFRTLDLERLAWYAPGKVLWIDSECNTETGHTDGVTELFDLSKNGHNATITGTLTYDDGYVFDGNTANYLTVPATSELDNAEELTYELSFSATNVANTQRLLYSSGWFEIYLRSGINVDLNFDGTPKEQLTKSPISTGFNTVSVVFKENEYQKVFVNGVEVYTTTASTNQMNCPIISIGQGGGSYPMASGSKVHAVRAYNRALTADEIASNYQLDAGRWGALPVYIDDGSITITATGYTQGDITVDYVGDYLITQRSTEQLTDKCIEVIDAAGVTVFLKDLNIKNPTAADGYPPGCIDIKCDANVVLIGDNNLEGGDDRAGTITIHNGTTIINANGAGKLTAKATVGRSAGIHVLPGSTLQIDGGIIKAQGRHSAAGIGVSGYRAAGTIIINGGIVIATGSATAGYYHSAGIGGSRRENGATYYSCEKVEINGGTVTATSGNALYVDDIFANVVIDNR